jgi:hypothetical protein
MYRNKESVEQEARVAWRARTRINRTTDPVARENASRRVKRLLVELRMLRARSHYLRLAETVDTYWTGFKRGVYESDTRRETEQLARWVAMYDAFVKARVAFETAEEEFDHVAY